MARTRLYLVRHGEHDPASGHAPGGGLSALGREQADRVGRRLRKLSFGSVHHSPLARAAETADIAGRHFPGTPRHSGDFVADRTPWPSAKTGYPQRWHGWLDGVPIDERDRDATALRAAVEHFGVLGDGDRDELLITHNFVIGWFVRHVLDAPDWRWLGLNQANGGITVVQWESGRPATLIAFNDTGHLDAEDA
ncbi:histidine phosphatase family protein [Actinoplanes sp. NPDC051513]|uniref:histidine phosphatase family protein n=1 Tax=Actinoplanes sp. NPDC051513 TaxID=3363908 RepID=UPI00378A885E